MQVSSTLENRKATLIYLGNLRYNMIQRPSIWLQNIAEPSENSHILHPALPLAVARGSICSRMNCLCIKPLSGPTRVSRLLSMRKPKSERVLWGLVCSMDHFSGDATRPHGSGECAMILVTSGIVIALYHHSMQIKCGIYVIPYCSYYAIFTSSHQPSWLCYLSLQADLNRLNRIHMDLWSHTMYI